MPPLLCVAVAVPPKLEVTVTSSGAIKIPAALGSTNAPRVVNCQHLGVPPGQVPNGPVSAKNMGNGVAANCTALFCTVKPPPGAVTKRDTLAVACTNNCMPAGGIPFSSKGTLLVAVTFKMPRFCMLLVQTAELTLIASAGCLDTSITTSALDVKPVLGLVALAINTICAGPKGALNVSALGWFGGMTNGLCAAVPALCTQLIPMGMPLASVAVALKNTLDAEFTVIAADGNSVITGGAAFAVTAAAPTTGAPAHNDAAKAGVGMGGAQGAGSS